MKRKGLDRTTLLKNHSFQSKHDQTHILAVKTIQFCLYYQREELDHILTIRNTRERKRKRERGREDGFPNKVVDNWRSLINHRVRAESVGSFGRRLDKFMDKDDRWMV